MYVTEKNYCHICRSNQLEKFARYEQIRQISSDCKNSESNAMLAICKNCHVVQKITDTEWDKSVNNIYDDYSIYSLSNGEEQVVFDTNGNPMRRSECILYSLQEFMSFGHQGTILDIGCGNGSWLKTFGKKFSDWSLSGTEWNRNNEKFLQNIQNFKNLYTCDVDEIHEKYDIISMIHVLEHIPDPMGFLFKVGNLLKKTGKLILQLPYYLESPFDLIVADHCSHFSCGAMKNILNNSGFSIELVSKSIVRKELTFVCGLGYTDNEPKSCNELYDDIETYDKIDNKLRCLLTISEKAADWVDKKPFGIFGTTIASSWLYFQLQQKADFFVDEDCAKINKFSFGKKIFHPSMVPEGANIIIPFTTEIAHKIQDRLKVISSNANYFYV